MNRSVTRALMLLAVIGLIMVGVVQHAQAAAGDLIADVLIADDVFGNSVAFDGQYLYYTGFNGQTLHRINPPPAGSSNATGHVSYPISGAPSGINALAYDAGRGMFWAGGGDGLSIYLLSKTGQATLRLTVDPVGSRPGNCKWNCLTEINGLAYDRADDTLWYSPDASFRIYHYQTTGDLLGRAVLVSGRPYIDLDVPPNDPLPQCGYNNAAGLAVGGAHLFLRLATGQQTCPYYFEYGKDGTKIAWYRSDLPRAQDLECDNLTYTVSVFWARDSFDGHIRAYEQPAAGACVYGGGPTPPPTTPTPPPLPILPPVGLLGL
jgi:hypothetical protein